MQRKKTVETRANNKSRLNCTVNKQFAAFNHSKCTINNTNQSLFEKNVMFGLSDYLLRKSIECGRKGIRLIRSISNAMSQKWQRHHSHDAKYQKILCHNRWWMSTVSSNLIAANEIANNNEVIICWCFQFVGTKFAVWILVEQTTHAESINAS